MIQNRNIRLHRVHRKIFNIYNLEKIIKNEINEMDISFVIFKFSSKRNREIQLEFCSLSSLFDNLLITHSVKAKLLSYSRFRQNLFIYLYFTREKFINNKKKYFFFLSKHSSEIFIITGNNLHQ